MELQGINLKALIEPLEGSEETISVDKDLDQKSQSQRMRSVIFLLWKQEGSQGEFRDYYYRMTEKIINSLKDKLDQ